MRLSIEVDEPTWRELRNAAELERSAQGRASINAVVNRLIAEYLKGRRKGGK